jgi:hypothetical protein
MTNDQGLTTRLRLVIGAWSLVIQNRYRIELAAASIDPSPTPDRNPAAIPAVNRDRALGFFRPSSFVLRRLYFVLP